MYSTVNMSERRRRFCLAVLLLILLAGVAGHVLLPADHAHAAHESTCPVHAGMLVAEAASAAIPPAGHHIGCSGGDAPALALAANIPHPPMA